LKRLLATSALTAALAAGAVLGATSVAGATTTRTHGAATAPAPHHGALAVWLRAHRKAVRQEAVAVSASTIGISRQQLVAELRTGKSIADVAAEHNVSSQRVIDALVTAADAKVHAEVTAGKLSAAHAQAIDARLSKLAAKVVDHVFRPHTPPAHATASAGS